MTHALALALALALRAAAQAPADVDDDPSADSAPERDADGGTDAANTGATPATPPTTLLDDAASEERYRACVASFQAGAHDEARRCWLQLAVTARGTVAAAKSEAALLVYDTKLHLPAVDAQPPGSKDAAVVPAGRYGTATAAGLFGAANAVGAGVMVAATAPDISPDLVVTGTAVGAVVLGAGGGIGGYLLADGLDLDEGAARLVASSLVWGTLLGAGLAPTTVSLVEDASSSSSSSPSLPIDAAVITVLVSGWAAGGAAVAVAMNLRIDEAQVAWMNSGAFAGSVIGLLLFVNLTTVPDIPVYALSAGYLLPLAGGIGAGVLLGQRLDTTWGEVLICDLGGVLGLVAGGAIGLTVGGNVPASFLAGGGLLAGYGAGIAVVETFRASRGAPLGREGPEVKPAVVSAVDKSGRAVLGLGLTGAF